MSEYDRATCNYIGLRSLEVEVERATVESDHTTVLESRLVISVSGSLVSAMCGYEGWNNDSISAVSVGRVSGLIPIINGLKLMGRYLTSLGSLTVGVRMANGKGK